MVFNKKYAYKLMKILTSLSVIFLKPSSKVKVLFAVA